MLPAPTAKYYDANVHDDSTNSHILNRHYNAGHSRAGNTGEAMKTS